MEGTAINQAASLESTLKERGSNNSAQACQTLLRVLDAHHEHGLEKDPSGLRQGLAEKNMRFSQRNEHQVCF